MKIEFYNSCNCIVNEDLLICAMTWFFGSARSSKIFLWNGYPAIAFGAKRMTIHRLLALHRANIKKAPKMHAHHKDDNKLNSDIDNIDFISASDHLKIHMTGKVFSQEHRNKISKANKGRSFPNAAKRKLIPVDEIRDLYNKGFNKWQLAKKYNVCWHTINDRIKQISA